MMALVLVIKPSGLLGREPARAARRFVRGHPRLADAARRTLTEVGRLRER